MRHHRRATPPLSAPTGWVGQRSKPLHQKPSTNLSAKVPPSRARDGGVAPTGRTNLFRLFGGLGKMHSAHTSGHLGFVLKTHSATDRSHSQQATPRAAWPNLGGPSMSGAGQGGSSIRNASRPVSRLAASVSASSSAGPLGKGGKVRGVGRRALPMPALASAHRSPYSLKHGHSWHRPPHMGEVNHSTSPCAGLLDLHRPGNAASLSFISAIGHRLSQKQQPRPVR